MSAKQARSSVLTLEQYLPYRLSILSNRVSMVIAQAYKDKFGLTITEWRIMAVLGEYPGASADEVSNKTQIEKSMISRAVQKLLARHLITRHVDEHDRRRQNLELTGTGKEVYEQIVPISYDYEDSLITCLSDREIKQLNSIIEKLQDQAEKI
ncbi:MAG: MarR family winged helix-turn-helix transcriptional regulator [Gammaproteobacteria bacterium]|nr:MarR family winged helix-turn-helix transcriptional regulator [Gammaproteobacteria bacterium]